MSVTFTLDEENPCYLFTGEEAGRPIRLCLRSFRERFCDAMQGAFRAKNLELNLYGFFAPAVVYQTGFYV